MKLIYQFSYTVSCCWCSWCWTLLGSRAETYCFQRTGICHSDQPPSVRILLVIASMKPHVSVERGNVFELWGASIYNVSTFSDISGHFWDISGHFWDFLFGLFLDLFGLFWTFLDFFGHFWTLMNTFGHFCKVQRADLTCHVTRIRLQRFEPWPIRDEYSRVRNKDTPTFINFWIFKLAVSLPDERSF